MLRWLSSFTLILIFVLGAMTSCSIETARVKKSPFLVIASDFLTAQDTILFKEFVRKNNVRVIIHPMSGDEVLKKIRESAFNSGLDLILMQNSNTALRLNNAGVIHDFDKEENSVNSQNPFVSYTHNFVGIGVDPFVFKYRVDSIRTATHYQDLTTVKHHHTLSDADILGFLSPIRKERTRAQTYDWIKKWKKVGSLRPSKGPWSDSAQVILCKYSQLNTFQDSTWAKYEKEYLFPNTDRAGVYFDLVTVSIVNQAEHFSEAQKFLAFCQNSGHNSKLNARINRFPVYPYLSARKNGPQLYPAKIDELLQYHEVLRRLLTKLKQH